MWISVTALLAVSLGGCPPWTDNPQVAGDSVLVPFDSPGDILNYFKRQANQRMNMYQRGPFFGGMGMVPTAAEDAANGGDTSGDGGDTSFSQTNIQEEGVDESDVFKSDGVYFYISHEQTLSIVQATPPADMTVIGELDFDAAIESLYLRDGEVIVLTQQYSGGYPGDGAELLIWPPYYVGSEVGIHQVDVNDPANPTVTHTLEVDGNLVTSRVVNERLLLVLSIVPQLPDLPNALTIGAMTLDEVMPKARASGASADAVAWSDWLHPTTDEGYYMTAVVTIDAANVETIIDSVGVMANAGTIYASTEALYLTDTNWDAADNYREQTAVHKLAYDDNGVARYVASGAVPGRLLNQFSLSEYEGNLRLATHVDNFGLFWGGGIAVDAAAPPTAQASDPPDEPYNAVYVLSQVNTDLEIVGAVENIAPNETLHSARFMGDHGFLVTFRQIDPLFVLDLTDPADPQVVSELILPGFSDYLHPLGDTHLIGVGKYTEPTQQGFDWFGGVQLSLFDVSDWTNPTVVEQLEIGGRGSWCETDSTHKAFTFVEESGLLALPMTLFTEEQLPWEYGELAFAGVVVFQVDAATGFEELGRIPSVTPSDFEGYWWWYGFPGWQRAAIIGDAAYALSPSGVRAANVVDFETTTTLELPGTGD